MTDTTTRRGFCSMMAGTMLVRALPAAAQDDQRRRLTTTTLTERVSVIAGAGANITVLSGAEGLLLVDGGSAVAVGALRDVLATGWPGRAVEIVFNTNWRPEHTGFNAAAAAAGARVIAHENTRLWMGANFEIEWEATRHSRQPPDEWPTETFYRDAALDFAGHSVEYRHLPRAHTDGDLCVSLTDQNVLAVGDLLAVDGYPILDYSTGGWIRGFADATRTLLDLCDADTRIVPAVGPVQSRAALAEQLQMCTHVLERLSTHFRSGGNFSEWMASNSTEGFTARRGDATLFLEQAYRGALGHLRNLGGII